MLKERRISNPGHVKAIIAEQLNILRLNDELEPIAKAKAIAYLSNTALSAYKDKDLAERVEKIMKQLEIK